MIPARSEKGPSAQLTNFIGTQSRISEACWLREWTRHAPSLTLIMCDLILWRGVGNIPNYMSFFGPPEKKYRIALPCVTSLDTRVDVVSRDFVRIIQLRCEHRGLLGQWWKKLRRPTVLDLPFFLALSAWLTRRFNDISVILEFFAIWVFMRCLSNQPRWHERTWKNNFVWSKKQAAVLETCT